MATARTPGTARPRNCRRTSNTLAPIVYFPIDRGEAPTHLSQLFSVQRARAPAKVSSRAMKRDRSQIVSPGGGWPVAPSDVPPRSAQIRTQHGRLIFFGDTKARAAH